MSDTRYIAIDSPTTRDVDDAIALSPADSGGWKASVLIANPAAVIPIGSSEDAFARKQGATVYMGPKTVQSMLPRHIAEHQAALAAGKKRPAMQIDLAISEAFDVSVQGLSFGLKAIHAHVPYTTVAERARNAEDPLCEVLRQMIAVSQGLLASRRNHGALAYYDLNRLLFLDEEGRVRQAKNKDDAIGQILVQEFMILANAAIASWAAEKDLPILFRNHHAKSAAPAAPDLARTVQGWLSGTALNETAAREQLDLILGVASYGASVEGHYALNLPAYAHGTSPIRRYADLVTQRQLHAALTGASPPYSKSNLQEIAVDINETLAKRKQERKDGFKETIVRRATTALRTQRFDTLADHELSQALKLAAENGDYPDALVATVTDRIRQGILTDKVYDRLLEAPSGSLPASITSAWADLLNQAPYRSGHLINHGLQGGLFAEYKSSTTRASADVGPFTDHASIRRLLDGEVLQAKGQSPRKQDAVNIAAARLIMIHIGAAIPAPTRQGADAATPTTNFKGRLQERCQKHRWAMPRYDVTSEGPPNAARFHCTVTLQAGTKTLTASARDARTRIGAEHSAAEALLAQLPSEKQPSTASNSNGNPVGWLQEQCQKAGQPLPAYTIVDNPDGTFTCTVEASVLKGRQFSATAANKAEAKRAAAGAAAAGLREVATATA